MFVVCLSVFCLCVLLYAINVFVCSVCDVLSGVVWYGVCFVCACVRVDLNACVWCLWFTAWRYMDCVLIVCLCVLLQIWLCDLYVN